MRINIMKRFILLITLALCVSSCTKDEQKTTFQKICGKWEVVRWEHFKEGVLETSQDGNFTDQIYLFSEEGAVKIFQKDGSVKEYAFSFDEPTQTIQIPKIDKKYIVISISNTEMKWQLDSWAVGREGAIAYQSYYFLTRK